MIACPTCGYDNPLGTRFCRSCGAKLDIKLAHVVGSIEQTKRGIQDDRIATNARNALTVSMFLLACALVFRWVIVPKMPIADLPPVELGAILPEATATAPAGTAPAAAPAAMRRLSWRRDNAIALIGSLGVDLTQIQAQQKALIAAQQADGSFGGDEIVAATGLAALALQALPRDEAVVAAATRARAFLQGACKDLSGKPPLSRALCLAALLDAEELQPADFAKYSVYLVDGKAPVWQMFALPLLSNKDRPQTLTLLRAALPGTLASWSFDYLEGKTARPDSKAFYSESAKNLAGGEDRMLWAFTAWHFATAPKDLAMTMAAWSRADVPGIDRDTMTKCGPTSTGSVAVLTLAAPARVPPLWLVRK